MPHLIEAATSGRAKCRGCGGTIENQTPRFGERIANPFGRGDATLWFSTPAEELVPAFAEVGENRCSCGSSSGRDPNAEK